MAMLTGGYVWDTYYKRNVAWRPVGPVVDEYVWLTHSGTDEYVCLGVVGNADHWNTPNGEDHTSRATGWTYNNAGQVVRPLAGWVYAFDARVPEMSRFEQWMLGRLRAGFYTHLIKYFNINNRHWNRKNKSNGVMFGYATNSGDSHLHMSFMPGAEYAHSTVLSDYETFRQTGRSPDNGLPSSGAAADWTAGPLAQLPTVQLAATGQAVKMMEGLLSAHGFITPVNGTADEATILELKAFQAARTVANSVVGGQGDGICGPMSWAALVGAVSTVIYGSKGLHVAKCQGLLSAHGFATGIDGLSGPDTLAKLKGFQVARAVPNSVVGGRGDGICGQATWTSLLTA